MIVNQKRIVLTGAAGGLGRELARQLAAQGAQLALVDRNRESLDQLCLSLRQQGHIANPIVTDFASERSSQDVISQAQRSLGGIDILINSAGTLDFTHFEQQDPARIQQIMHINTVVPLLLTRAVLPYFLERQHGQIVNIGSIFGYIGFPHYATYSASKFALRGFSQALRRELFDQPIKVSYIAPRAIKTPINNAASSQMMQATKTAMDEPHSVANLIIKAIVSEKEEYTIGQPESLFAWLNSSIPSIVSQGLKKPTQIARQFLK